MQKTILLVTVLFLGGCSAHSAWIAEDTTDTTPIAEAQYPAHENKVFVTKDSIKQSQCTPVARIDIGKAWYGSTDNVLESMAIRAREIGADAVIEVKTWRQPSGWSWAAPHGTGLAVKMKDNDLDFSGLSGKWL